MIGETVTVQTGTATTDRNGNSVVSWADPTETSIDGVALAPIQAGEDNANSRQGVVIGWTAYIPPGNSIEPTARIVARGNTYEIDGEPADWRDPYTGRKAGLELTLRRVEG